jgi:hypothetical protein
MKIETIYYCMLFDKTIYELKKHLPEFVKKSIIKPKHDIEVDIRINAQNREAVEYLDNKLREYISAGRCIRRCQIEIDEKEIINYMYFRILPFVVSYGNSFIADVKMPDCNIDGCFMGSKLLSPVKIIKRKITDRVDIATLDYPWEKEIVLFLSSRMKKIFEAEDITGLDYEPAKFIAAAHRKKFVRIDGISKFIHKEIPVENAETLESPFIARFSRAIYREADWIFQEIRCQAHSVFGGEGFNTTSFVDPVNSKISQKDIGELDFFQVQGVKVHGKTHNNVRNWFYISRKVLELLLKYDAKGLHRVGSIIKSKFAPVLEISED